MESDETDVRNDKIYTKDRYRCRNCGRTGGDKGEVELHTHHIVPRKDGGSDRLSNLVTLCRDCHKAAHLNGHEAPTIEYKDLAEFVEKHGASEDDETQPKNESLSGRTELNDFDKDS